MLYWKDWWETLKNIMQATSSYLCCFRQNIFPAFFPSDLLLQVCCRAQASDYSVNQWLERSLMLAFTGVQTSFCQRIFTCTKPWCQPSKQLQRQLQRTPEQQVCLGSLTPTSNTHQSCCRFHQQWQGHSTARSQVCGSTGGSRRKGHSSNLGDFLISGYGVPRMKTSPPKGLQL